MVSRAGRALAALRLRRAAIGSGSRYWRSEANFVLVRVGDRGAAIVEALRGARHLRPRPLDAAGLRRLHPHHDRRRRAHRAVRCAALEEVCAPRRDRPQTTETQIQLKLGLEGRGRYDVQHRHPLPRSHAGAVRAARRVRSDVAATGDLDVDQHHTVEDVGIALGEAVSQALGDRRGINRAGYFVMPMDETLAVAAIDLGGRPHAVVDLKLNVRHVGDLQTELVHDFFEGFAIGARANVHVKVLYGRSSHHHVEAVFKAFARALRVACAKDKQLAKNAAEHERDCCERSR